MGNSSSAPAPAPCFSASSPGEQVAAAFPGAAAGKTYLITGGAGGLGFETARVLAEAGAAEVVIAARSQTRCDEAVAKLQAAVPSGRFSALVVDLGDLTSVHRAAAAFLATGKLLHCLVNNAGILAVPYAETAQGFESQFGTNHLGHFALTQALLPALQRSAPSRVVSLSSAAHCFFAPPEGVPLDEVARRNAGTAADPPASYGPWRAYAASKMANLLHAAEFNRRYGGGASSSGVAAVSVHPGVIMETPAELKRSLSVGAILSSLFDWRALKGAVTEKQQGTATIILAALAPFEGTPAAATAPLALHAGRFYADCALVPPQPEGNLHERALDADLARQLWALSERLVSEANAAPAATSAAAPAAAPAAAGPTSGAAPALGGAGAVAVSPAIAASAPAPSEMKSL